MDRGVSGTLSIYSWSALLVFGVFCLATNGTDLEAQSAPIPFLGASAPSTGSLSSQGQGLGVEVLTDTMGVNFSPYMKQVIEIISEGILATKTNTHANMERSAVLSFTITPDGKVTTLHLDQSSHDTDLDRAVWQSISQAQALPRLPEGFTGPGLNLRVRYTALKAPGKAS